MFFLKIIKYISTMNKATLKCESTMKKYLQMYVQSNGTFSKILDSYK